MKDPAESGSPTSAGLRLPSGVFGTLARQKRRGRQGIDWGVFSPHPPRRSKLRFGQEASENTRLCWRPEVCYRASFFLECLAVAG